MKRIVCFFMFLLFFAVISCTSFRVQSPSYTFEVRKPLDCQEHSVVFWGRNMEDISTFWQEMKPWKSSVIMGEEKTFNYRLINNPCQNWGNVGDVIEIHIKGDEVESRDRFFLVGNYDYFDDPQRWEKSELSDLKKYK